MNNGANIVFLGTSVLQKTHGDVLTTSEANRTELSRRYFIRKDLKANAADLLQIGYGAPDFSNLYLLNLPRLTTDATHAYFDCTFSGILSVAEKGNGPLYEKVERTGNIASISTTVIYVQPVYRFFYTIKKDADDRILTRELVPPSTITARNSAGAKVVYPGSSFYWEPSDVQRRNFDKYDEVIESWRLSYSS